MMENDEQAQIGVFGICYNLEYLIIKHADNFYEELSKNEQLRQLVIDEMNEVLCHGYYKVEPVWSFIDVQYFIQNYTFDIAKEIASYNLTNVFIDLYNSVLNKDDYTGIDYE